MRLLNLVVLMVLLIVVGGCFPSQYLVDTPYVLYPQGVSTEEGVSIQEKSMQALLDSFEDYKWELHEIDKESGTITAAACRRGEHCAEVVATVGKDGSVSLIRTPGQRLSEDEGVLLQRWLGNIQRAYNKHMESK